MWAKTLDRLNTTEYIEFMNDLGALFVMAAALLIGAGRYIMRQRQQMSVARITRMQRHTH